MIDQDLIRLTSKKYLRTLFGSITSINCYYKLKLVGEDLNRPVNYYIGGLLKLSLLVGGGTTNFKPLCHAFLSQRQDSVATWGVIATI
jgi:hypothetical protein